MLTVADLIGILSLYPDTMPVRICHSGNPHVAEDIGDTYVASMVEGIDSQTIEYLLLDAKDCHV
jgi:hypothetical protein